METSGKNPEHVAGNFWFVFFAYFLVITAWYTVSGNVFISSRWKTVAETRKRGKRHFIVLSLAMSYLAVYVHFQVKSDDYKEVCLTLVAFAVVILHILRTVLGLWQLRVFKHWVIRSIRSMESLGYRVQLSGAGNGKNTQQGRDRAHFDADCIIVNDSIIGNRLAEGLVQCDLQFFTPKKRQDMFCADSFMMRVPLTLFYLLKRTVCLGGIIWSLLFSRSSMYSKPDSTPFLRPREPEDLWLSWATVLISRAFPHWLTEMRNSRSEEVISQESGYEVHRDRFAEDVLRSAALHCERDTAKTSPGSFLPFHLWRKLPKLSRGTFCKQEFLKHACTTGNGLPFQAPHKNAASRIEDGPVYNYAKYRLKLEQARDALPANEGEKLTYLGIEELEWLSVFLSIEDWSIGRVEEDNDQGNLNNVQTPKSDFSGIAIENLYYQLGCPGNVKGFSERLAAPFLKDKGAALWGNRNVLNLSAHVDNWLALLAGEQVAYMVERVYSTEEGFQVLNLKTKDRVKRTQEPVSVTEGIEKQMLMSHLSVSNPEFAHFEQSLTFLGCSMENLRSSMAKWVESNPEEQSGAWTPTLGSSSGSTDAMNCGKCGFHASKDFESCLSQVSSVSCWSQRYLQMRLLWELQNNLHNTLSERGLSPNQTEAILLCMLSFPAIRVMASEIEQTPESAASVQRNRNFCCIKIDEKPPPFLIENCKLTLLTSYIPQKVQIEVFFRKQVNEPGIVVTTQLCGDEFEEGKPFFWEAWRDAFCRSLQSTREWPDGRKIANSFLSIPPAIDRIETGIYEIETANSRIGPTMKVWKGWPPHRKTLSKYEMMTNGLILERNTAVTPAKSRFAHAKVSTFSVRPRIQYVSVSYEEATVKYLTRASLIAQGFLHKATGCSEDETVGKSSKGHKDLELLRYEISATKAGDDIALGKAMNMLISENPNREAIERSVELLEEYFILEATKAPSVRILQSLSRPVRPENWVQKIKGHYEELMRATRFDPVAVISFARFCSAVPSYRKEVLNEDGIRALAIAIVRNKYSGNMLLTFELTKSFEFLLETGIKERYYLACSMALNKIEHASMLLSRTRNSIPVTNTRHLIRGFMSFFGIFENSCGEENIPLLPDFRSELEKRKSGAQVRLEELLRYGKYYPGKYSSRAEELYRREVDDGDLVAACHLAFIFQNSAKFDKSRSKELYTQAIELYTRAIDGGIDSVLCPLALFYNIGLGVPKNSLYAAELYTRAIERNGDILAMYNLADMLHTGREGVQVDEPRAFKLFSRAVEEGGFLDAMDRLAYFLQAPPEGIPKDVPYAVRLYECVIKERGDTRAKMNLARLLEHGADGVPANLKRAIALYKSVVDESDNTRAMFKLGELYLKGTGVRTDAVRATQLFQRVIDMNGNADALVHLADVLKDGAIGVPKDPVRAVELYTRAIEEHGSGDAMFELAQLLEFGEKGVSSDSSRAFSLYKRAASEKKHSKAARRLRKLKTQKQVLEQVKHRWSK